MCRLAVEDDGHAGRDGAQVEPQRLPVGVGGTDPWAPTTMPASVAASSVRRQHPVWAAGYLSADVSSGDLARAVRAVGAGHTLSIP